MIQSRPLVKISEEVITHLHNRFVEISKRSEPVRLVAHLWAKILQCEEYKGDAAALERDSRFLAWYLVQQNKRDKRMPGSLRLKNLLQEDKYFADLAEAQAICPNQYAQVLKRSRSEAKPDASAPTPPTDEDTVRADTAAGLRALREQLGGICAEEVDRLKSANPEQSRRLLSEPLTKDAHEV